jgi:glycosyltransferase involved in cell wall biosynthesis
MRLLCVDLGSGWGGSERYLVWLMEALRARGHWVGCVAPRRELGPACDRLWLTGSRFKQLPRARRLIATLAAAERVDIVHYNADRAIHLAPFVPLPKRVARTATKHLTRSPPKSPRDLRTHLENRLTELSLSRLDCCICVSQSMLDELPPAARRRAVLIENGVPDERPPAFVAAGSDRAVFLGRISPEKGIDDLLELARRCAARPPPERSWTLAVAGTGPLEQRVAAAAASLPSGVLAHLGFQSEPAHVYAAAAALLLPSSHEGLPLVILEAFSWGLPVVAYDIPGVRDVVTPGRNGILVPPAEGVDGLERALDRLFAATSDRTELGHNARADYDARYTLERMLAATAERLESVALEAR